MKKQLYEFLNGESTSAFIEDESGKFYTHLAKVDSNIEDVYIIYQNEYISEPVAGLFNELEIAGIYDKDKRILYYYNFWPLLTFEGRPVKSLIDMQVISISNLSMKIKEEVKDEIISRVKNDENYFSTKDMDKVKDQEEDISQTVKRKSYNFFMDSKELDDNEYTSLLHLQELNGSNSYILHYLDDEKKIIDMLAEKYIKKYKLYILKTIIINKLTKVMISFHSEDEKFLERKKVYSILSNNEDRKTVYVELKKGEEILESRIETSSRYIDGRIHSWDIDANKRDKFEKIFDTSDELQLDMIKKIVFRNKILYERI